MKKVTIFLGHEPGCPVHMINMLGTKDADGKDQEAAGSPVDIANTLYKEKWHSLLVVSANGKDNGIHNPNYVPSGYTLRPTDKEGNRLPKSDPLRSKIINGKKDAKKASKEDRRALLNLFMKKRTPRFDGFTFNGFKVT